MSRLLRSAAVAALTAAAALAAAGSASAQDYSRLVVFGDSLSDNGNLFALTGQPPAPYVQGRFSNGPTFVELLGFNLARIGTATTSSFTTGSIDYAYGGARTDLTVFNPFVTPATVPGMQTQLNAYTAAGGTFGASTLVSVLGGANNIFQAIPTAGASSNPTGAITPVSLGAASDINFIVNSVAAAGAGTVLVTNLPKLSLTPEFRPPSPAAPAAPLADFAVTTFNSALLTGLTATAAARPGTNIILMDLFKIGDVIAANPGAFGITNITQPCFTGMSVCTNPNSFFYFDGVHPTAAGHVIIARLAEDYLYYGDNGAQSAVQGETSFRHRQDGLDASSAMLSGREAWGGTAISVTGLYDTSDTDARGPVGAAEATSYGGRMTLESGTPSMRVGLAGSFMQADVEAGAMTFDVESLAVDVYGGWRSDSGVFVNVAGGAARDTYRDIRRQTSLAPVVHTGRTDGESLGLKGQAGTWFDMGGIALSPRVGVSWVSTDVDGYVEQGAAAQYSYSDRTIETLSAEAALRLEGGMGGGFGFFLEGGYRESLDDSSDDVGTRLQGSPSQTLFRDIEDPLGGQMMLSAGVNGMLGDRVKVSVGYRGRFADHTDSHTGGVTLTLPL